MPRRRRTNKRGGWNPDPTMWSFALRAGLFFGDGPEQGEPGWDAFRDHLEAMWERSREELLARELPGRRPWAWWEFERGEDPPGYDGESEMWCGEELARLVELDELGDAEIAAVLERGDEALAQYPPPYTITGPAAVEE